MRGRDLLQLWKHRKALSSSPGKPTAKLAWAAGLALLSLTMVSVGTYAWMSVSTSPVIDGVSVMISGRSTIQIAADTVYTDENQNTVHLPGEFGDSLTLTSSGAVLTPVSTADGLNWFQPVYGGSLGELTGFADAAALAVDGTDEDGGLGDGCFVYYDIWLLSPGADYDLHISVGEEDSADGSYVLSVPDLTAGDETDYQLDASAASVRVGFLVLSGSDDEAVSAYFASNQADEQVQALQGTSDEDWSGETTDFTIYEPNADWHDASAESYTYAGGELTSAAYASGGYAATQAIVSAEGDTEDVTAITAVQLTSAWREDSSGVNLATQYNVWALNQTNPTVSGFLSAIQYQLDDYVKRGRFLQSTAALTGLLDSAGTGTVEKEAMDALATSGAAGDVAITQLEAQTAQRIRIFIWLEGQDADCVSQAQTVQLLVRLELAGESQ
ncbi:MAG: hypothetical protein LUD69_08330 [Oscillospiraceae bacterium]|nr:hypothetical protein [Oscillospiraceae bacterium]